MRDDFRDYVLFLYESLVGRGEERPGQRLLLESLAQKIAAAAEGAAVGGRPFMAPTEAPTGTGKSYVLLLLALAAFRRYGWKSVVSSQTKVLQQQLTGKDIPAVRRILGPVEDVESWKCSLVKGMGNYPCLRKLSRIMRMANEKTIRYRHEGDIRILKQQDVRGVYLIVRSSSVDLDRSAISESNPVLPVIVAQRHSCAGKDCPHYARECLYQRALRSTLPLIVTNHAMITGIIRSRHDRGVLAGTMPEGFDATGTGKKKKERPTTLVGANLYLFDEAHHLMDYSSSADSVDAVPFGVVESALSSPLPVFVGAGEEDSESLIGEIETCRDGVGEWWKRMADLLDKNPWSIQNSEGMEKALSDVGAMLARWGEANKKVLSMAPGSGLFQSFGQQQAEDIEISRLQVSRLEELFDSARAGGGVIRVDNEGIVCYTDHLRSLEQDMTESLSNLKGAVFTSGTLLLGGSADVFCAETGIRNADKPVSVPSPFDYRSMVVWIPKDVPDPSSDYPGHDLAVLNFVMKHVPPYVRAGLGGVLVLCSSLERMRNIGAELGHVLIPQGKVVLTQGSLPRMHLARKFIQSESPVLVASASFREGFDAAQERLTWVIIDKLPFLSPGDKGYAERIRRLVKWGVVDNAFKHALDLMQFSLIQSVGRLIRKTDDWGGVTILDPRIWDRGFSWGLDRCIPVPASEWMDLPDMDPSRWKDVVRGLKQSAKVGPLEKILDSLPDPWGGDLDAAFVPEGSSREPSGQMEQEGMSSSS